LRFGASDRAAAELLTPPSVATLPAAGGTDPEDIEAAKRAAPGSVAANQPRALVPSDYVRLAEQLPIVARAAADLRVTGSHRLITVAIQPINSADPPSWLQRDAHRSLHRVRRMGDQIRVRPPNYQPLYLDLTVTAARTAEPETVRRRVNNLLSAGWVDSYTPALFHPSQLRFGQTLRPSAVVAAVQGLPDVEDIVLNAWGFLPRPTRPQSPTAGPDRLRLGSLEMPRLDNDPVHPERGYVTVTVRSSS